MGLDIRKFFANKDVSTVTIKKFLANNKDNDEGYPTFSICLEDIMYYGELYNNTYLLGVGLAQDSEPEVEYQAMLKGVKVNESIISLINPNKAMKN